MTTSALVWNLKLSQTESILAARQSDLNEQNIRLQALENTLSGSQRSLKEKTRKLHEIQANISNLVVTSEAVQASLDVVAQRHKLCLERRSMLESRASKAADRLSKISSVISKKEDLKIKGTRALVQEDIDGRLARIKKITDGVDKIKKANQRGETELAALHSGAQSSSETALDSTLALEKDGTESGLGRSSSTALEHLQAQNQKLGQTVRRLKLAHELQGKVQAARHHLANVQQQLKPPPLGGHPELPMNLARPTNTTIL